MTWPRPTRALEKVQQGHGRFEAVYIAGDEREQVHNLSKARQPPGLGPQGTATPEQ